MEGKTKSLEKLTQHIFILPLATNIGVIAIPQKDSSTNVYLIDSGEGENHAKSIIKSLEASFSSPKIKLIINTHSHADHCGGNIFLKEKTGCQIWASTGEGAIMQCPEIETGLIWGGMPVKELKTPYFEAKRCRVDRSFKNDEEFSLENLISVKSISLKGHYIDQTGFLLCDTDNKRVLFAGDALSGRNVIKRYWIQYLFNESLTKQSLMNLLQIQADFYIPGHGQSVTQIEGLVELNLIALLETENMILDELKTPKTFEQILKAVADRNSIDLRLSQYALIGCTLRSYLSALCDEQKIAYEIKDNLMFWKKV
ncbi:MBL fold metallo-hydrolase [Treponema pectinovorum]|uniref:MBL fold metallo-hydrolase n=1 Tax=Treponema pectinovorum TaxID=164 RepID=UPI0011C8C18B|nr:MBL fold metallo-hydrolase [Treponema pectinovorum]